MRPSDAAREFVEGLAMVLSMAGLLYTLSRAVSAGWHDGARR